MYFAISAREAEKAMKDLATVEVPEGGDVDGEPLNSPNVLKKLPAHVQERVLENVDIIATYLRKDGDMGPVENKRGLTSFHRKGYQASLNADQYDPDRLVGTVGNGSFHIDISDPSNEEDR